MAKTEDSGENTGKPRKMALILALSALVGCGVGFGAPMFMASASAPAQEGDDHSADKNPEVSASLAEMPVGRITVALNKAGLPGRYLILDTIIEYDQNLLPHEPAEESGGHGKASAKDHSGSEGGLAAKHSHIRDAFIEYLTHVSEGEISGSAGMANLRGELLRRARAVSASDAPTAVLIQDFIIQ